MIYKQNDYVLFEYNCAIHIGKILFQLEIANYYEISFSLGELMIHASKIIEKLEKEISIEEAKIQFPEYFI